MINQIVFSNIFLTKLSIPSVELYRQFFWKIPIKKHFTDIFKITFCLTKMIITESNDIVFDWFQINNKYS